MTRPISPKAWFEYLKRVLASIVGAAARSARSSVSSKNGRASRHWPLSVPSRMIPALCDSNCPIVASAIARWRPSTYCPARSSSEVLRRSRSLTVATARRPARSGGGTLLGFVLVEHRRGSGAALFAEVVAVLGAAVVGVDAGAITALEMRHHVARIEPVGARGFLPAPPVVRLLQKD